MHKKIKSIIIIITIICYLSLLVPYLITSSIGESGIILEEKYVQSHSLPRDIQDQLMHQNGYYILILEDLSSDEQLAVISEHMSYKEGSFVRVSDSKNEWYSDSRVLSSIVSQPFTKIIIGKVDKVETGGWFMETIYSLEISEIKVILFELSSIDFLVGGFLFITILSLLIDSNLALWNISGILSCYSFQFFCINLIRFLNDIDIDATSMLFGLLFIILIPSTIWLRRYEDTDGGRQKIYKLFLENKKILLKIRHKFGI